MALSWDPKDPNEVLDYDLDWSARLATGDTIASSSWLVDVASITMDSDTFADTATKVWLSAGVLNTTYSLTNRVITTGGRTMDQTVKLKIKSK